MDHSTLLERIQQSDKAAFNELFGLLYQRLCRFAFLITHDGEMAAEVVQEVFVKLWETRERTKIATSANSYLYMAVRNTAANALKQKWVRRQYEEGAETINIAEADTFDQEAFMKHLRQAICLLPEQCRLVYHLKNFEGLTGTEVAQYLTLSEKTVENQYTIALSKLRQMLAPYRNSFFNDAHFKELKS